MQEFGATFYLACWYLPKQSQESSDFPVKLCSQKGDQKLASNLQISVQKINCHLKINPTLSFFFPTFSSTNQNIFFSSIFQHSLLFQIFLLVSFVNMALPLPPQWFRFTVWFFAFILTHPSAFSVLPLYYYPLPNPHLHFSWFLMFPNTKSQSTITKLFLNF